MNSAASQWLNMSSALPSFRGFFSEGSLGISWSGPSLRMYTASWVWLILLRKICLPHPVFFWNMQRTSCLIDNLQPEACANKMTTLSAKRKWLSFYFCSLLHTYLWISLRITLWTPYNATTPTIAHPIIPVTPFSNSSSFFCYYYNSLPAICETRFYHIGITFSYHFWQIFCPSAIIFLNIDISFYYFKLDFPFAKLYTYWRGL